MSLVLVVDDEQGIREIIADTLVDEGYQVKTAKSSNEALGLLGKIVPSAVLLDVWLEGSHIDGLGLLKRIKQQHPFVPVIMISGHANIKAAVNAIKGGAYDFLEKPFKIERLLTTLERAIENASIAYENSLFKSAMNHLGDCVSNSKRIRSVIKECEATAPTNSRVMLFGEHGTGKEFFARYIHSLSNRAKRPLMVFNAAKVESCDFASSLFGTEQEDGLRSAGLLERANGGTVFIDEISMLPKEFQIEFLNYVQTGQFMREGGAKTIKVDVRIITSSSCDVEHMAQEGAFNKTLFLRLSANIIKIPPLRDRQDDIVPLAEHFLKTLNTDTGNADIKFSHEVISVLNSYNWPGNLRQLRNAVECMIINSNNCKEIGLNLVPQDILQGVSKQFKSFGNAQTDGMPGEFELHSKKLKDAREIFEREYILVQLKKFSGNISKTAQYIGMDRTALHRKIKSLNIELDLAE